MTKKQLIQALEVYEDNDQLQVAYWGWKQTKIVPAAFISSFRAGNPPTVFVTGWDGPSLNDLKHFAALARDFEETDKPNVSDQATARGGRRQHDR